MFGITLGVLRMLKQIRRCLGKQARIGPGEFDRMMMMTMMMLMLMMMMMMMTMVMMIMMMMAMTILLGAHARSAIRIPTDEAHLCWHKATYQTDQHADHDDCDDYADHDDDDHHHHVGNADHDTHDQGNDKHTSVGIKPLIRQISKLIMVIISIMMIRIQKLVSDSQKGVFEMEPKWDASLSFFPRKGTVQEEKK